MTGVLAWDFASNLRKLLESFDICKYLPHVVEASAWTVVIASTANGYKTLHSRTNELTLLTFAQQLTALSHYAFEPVRRSGRNMQGDRGA